MSTTATEISRESVNAILIKQAIVKQNKTIRNRTARRIVRKEVTDLKDIHGQNVVYGYDKFDNIIFIDNSVAEAYILYKDTVCKHTSTFTKEGNLIVSCSGHEKVNGIYMPKCIKITDQSYRTAVVNLTYSDGEVEHQTADLYFNDKLSMQIQDNSCIVMRPRAQYKLVKRDDAVTLQHISGIYYTRCSENSDLYFGDVFDQIKSQEFDKRVENLFGEEVCSLYQKVGLASCLELVNLFFEQNVL